MAYLERGEGQEDCLDWNYDPDNCTPDIPNQNMQTYEAGGAFVPPEMSNRLLGLIYDNACVEALAKHVPMKREVYVYRSITDGVDGYWVGAQCVKQKDAMEFGGLELVARKMAVIVPFEDQLLQDMDVNMVSILNSDVAKKFVLALDRTFLGYEITSPFDDSLSGNVPVAHRVPVDTEGPDIVGDISYAISLIEEDGMEPNGMISHTLMKHILRNLRDDNNRPIYSERLDNCLPRERYCVWGIPICFTNQAAAQSSPAGYELLIADFENVLVGDRTTGIEFAKSNEATLTQGSSDPINMFEQDMTAFRYVIRKAFKIVNDNALAKVTGITR